MLITATAILVFGLLALYDAKDKAVKAEAEEDTFRFSRRAQLVRQAMAMQANTEQSSM